MHNPTKLLTAYSDPVFEALGNPRCPGCLVASPNGDTSKDPTSIDPEQNAMSLYRPWGHTVYVPQGVFLVSMADKTKDTSMKRYNKVVYPLYQAQLMQGITVLATESPRRK